MMLAVIRAALKLDIFDITYERSNEKLAILGFGADAQPRKGLLVRLASYLYWLCRYAGMQLKQRGPAAAPGAVIFFASSKNEFDSLSPIANRLERSRFVGPFGQARNNLNIFMAHVVGLLFLPLVIRRLLQSRGYQRASFAYILDQYLLGYGTYCVARWWFRATRPALLVVSNHLAVINRALLQAARDECLTTLYFLHATISDIYPPLETDYALLEGMDTLVKYDALGHSSVRVFLVGMAKHDSYRDSINTGAAVRTIGFCINGLDPTERVEDLCREIAREFPSLRVILRPHPADRRARHWMQLASELGFEFSDWKQEAAFRFLARVDVNIAGDSGIHLEAALLNVMPLYYAFDGKVHDLYGFRRNGLVDFAGDAPSCASWLRQLSGTGRPSSRERAKGYCATVATPWDWRSAELSCSIIEQILAGGQVGVEGWRRVPGVALDAYEPALARTITTILANNTDPA